MEILERVTDSGHEKVLVARESAKGYRGIIAIHSTVLGPAVGGTRFWNYASEEEALTDALRLSRGMTYKNALAGLPLGGGKSVIIGNSKATNREELLRVHGRFVEALGGRYITAEDVGTSVSDMEIVREVTSHVAGLLERSGDPSPVTARGVFRALQAAAKYLWKRDDLSGVAVAIQGCGNVGYQLAKSLHAAGARLIVTDVDTEKVSRIVEDSMPWRCNLKKFTARARRSSRPALSAELSTTERFLNFASASLQGLPTTNCWKSDTVKPSQRGAFSMLRLCRERRRSHQRLQRAFGLGARTRGEKSG